MEFMGFQMNAPGTFQEDHWFIIQILFMHLPRRLLVHITYLILMTKTAFISFWLLEYWCQFKESPKSAY